MQTNNKMAVAPVGKLIWQMSIPPLISMFLQYSYNLIDSAFVAQLSENALTAVSLSFPITTLMNAASIWIGVGVNVLIAGYLGKKEQDNADTVVTHGLLLAFGIGALLNLFALLIMRPYFWAFTSNEEIYQLSIAYMSVCSFMQIPNMVHIAIQKMIQATGNMVAPMWFQIAGVVVNFVLNPILIFGIGIFPAMGILGSAVATVAGYLLSMILALALLLGKKQKVKVKIEGFHLQKQMIGRIFALGLPSFIMNALSSFMVTFVNLFLVAYSDTAIAFFGAYFKVQQLIVMTVNGLIQGCLPVMRFNYGAGNRERLHSAFLWNLRYADYGGKLSVLRPFYHDFNLFSSDGKSNFQYVDSTVAAASPANSVHVVHGKTSEDYRNLAVISCHRSNNICSGVPVLSSRQEKRNTLRRYKVTVIIRKERQYGNTD